MGTAIHGRNSFNTQPPEGGWVFKIGSSLLLRSVSTHSRPKAAGFADLTSLGVDIAVSTHSRPKAAGPTRFCRVSTVNGFQHTAARRRLEESALSFDLEAEFQHTAARRRLEIMDDFNTSSFSFNTQPPEGGWIFRQRFRDGFAVSTHSRPKAAGYVKCSLTFWLVTFQHTAARRRLDPCADFLKFLLMFQHTAARRRLEMRLDRRVYSLQVSTHSRPKAAGSVCLSRSFASSVSTHSRPKAAGIG